jgi:hypothetical protein
MLIKLHISTDWIKIFRWELEAYRRYSSNILSENYTFFTLQGDLNELARV